MKHHPNQRYFWTIACIITIFLATLLIIIATFGKPVADQLSFINRFYNYGTTGLVADLYQHNSGRISQALGIGLSYQFFGAIKAQVIVPITLLLLLSLSCFWFYWLAFQKHSHRTEKAVILGGLTAAILIYIAPCLFDVYLWLDSAFVYLGSTIGIILNLDIFVWMLTTQDFRKKKSFIPLCLLAIMSLLFNEAAMALVFGWALVSLIASLCIKKWKKYRPITITFFITSCIAAIIMVCAPGTWSRAAAESGTANLADILLYFPSEAISNIMHTWSIWKIILAILLGILISSEISTSSYQFKARHFFIGGILCFLTITYGTLIVIFYGQKYSGLASRTMFTPNLGIFMAILLVTIGIFYYIFSHQSFKPLRITMSAAFVTILCIISAPGFLQFNRDFISILAIRNNSLARREILIYKYQSGEVDQLILPDLPVMFARSNASDFTVNNTTYYEWFYDNFVNYYHINPEDLLVQGGDIKSDWWDVIIPDWYSVSEMQICAENNSLIDTKYLCSNQ